MVEGRSEGLILTVSGQAYNGPHLALHNKPTASKGFALTLGPVKPKAEKQGTCRLPGHADSRSGCSTFPASASRQKNPQVPRPMDTANQSYAIERCDAQNAQHLPHDYRCCMTKQQPGVLLL